MNLKIATKEQIKKAEKQIIKNRIDREEKERRLFIDGLKRNILKRV